MEKCSKAITSCKYFKGRFRVNHPAGEHTDRTLNVLIFACANFCKSNL